MAENQTNKERIDEINVKLDNIISSLENKAGTSLTTLKTVLDTTKSTAYLFAYINTNNDFPVGSVTNLDEIISFNDTSNVINMTAMFETSSSLLEVSLFNTQNVTIAQRMFYGCSNLKTVPLYDFSSLLSGMRMFEGCTNLERLPNFDFSGMNKYSDKIRFQYMFNNCKKLEGIPYIKLEGNNTSSFLGTFSGCNNLSYFHAYAMNYNFDIHYSTLFTEEALVEILNNLATVTTATILTMGSTNLAKLTDEDKAIATAKGWTLA